MVYNIQRYTYFLHFYSTKGHFMKQVFIDGASGTTGLRIYERLAARSDISLITLPAKDWKDPSAIRDALNRSDIAFLGLPDEAALEAAEMVENPATVVLDASTAHRTAAGWVYGFPELSESQREAVRAGRRIAVPGCHASGMIALIYPLVESGLIRKDTALFCFSLTGYSGGGKKMIAQYQAGERSALLDAPRQYALTQRHKHLKEITHVTGLTVTPVFCPIVADFYSGMEVTVPLFIKDVQGSAEDVRACLKNRYRDGLVRYQDGDDGDGFLSAAQMAWLDTMTVTVLGNEERLLLCARFDNLGKGASGAAIQCMNLTMGVPEETGLCLVRK